MLVGFFYKLRKSSNDLFEAGMLMLSVETTRRYRAISKTTMSFLP